MHLSALFTMLFLSLSVKVYALTGISLSLSLSLEVEKRLTDKSRERRNHAILRWSH